jgi:translation initiation factor 1
MAPPGDRVVYDSAVAGGGACHVCGKPLRRCPGHDAPARRAAPPPAAPALPRDGVVRILRDRKGRGGKTVTVVAGVGGGPDALARLATDLKRLCGTGGTVKEGQVEIQGDHRERIAEALRARGLTVKLAGG